MLNAEVKDRCMSILLVALSDRLPFDSSFKIYKIFPLIINLRNLTLSIVIIPCAEDFVTSLAVPILKLEFFQSLFLQHYNYQNQYISYINIETSHALN